MLADDTIRAVLRTSWHLQPDGLTLLAGGLDSLTWLVNAGPNRYVAKAVHHSRQQQLTAGLSASSHLADQGFSTGTPLRCVNGGVSAPAASMLLTVLRYEQGRSLVREDPVDQLWWGDRLAACHRSLSTFTHPGAGPWHSLRTDAEHLELQSWLRPAVQQAVEACEKLMVLDRLTAGFLHGDPRPEAFLLDAGTGHVGIVGWGHVAVGPLLYDLASAVMYAGGAGQAEGILEAYATAGAVPKAELESALPTLLRLRWAVQADHFARRLVTAAGGAASTTDDLRGLTEARTALLG